MTRLLSQLRRDTRFLLCLEDAVEYRVLVDDDGAGQPLAMPTDTEVVALW